MFTAERRQVILSALAVHRSMSVSDLARLTRCSEITIRRDLRVLEESGQVLRQRGGASAASSRMDEPTYSDKTRVASDEKAQIARLAASMVEDGDVVLLLGGTTTQALARRLVGRRLMVVTNSVLVAHELANAPEVEVFLVGGMLRGSIHATVGGDSERALAGMHFATVFLSGNGLSAAHGLTTPNVHVASLDRAAVEASDQVTVLVDHTKIGVATMVRTVPTQRIDLVVTDASADADELAALRAAGVEVRVAEPAGLVAHV
jgi:DeoR/GlpR family transcriptional regulator of sugar metabolism